MERAFSDLSDDARVRYLELAVFPHGVPLEPAVVTRLWHQTAGLTELAARELVLQFRNRSLIQDNLTLPDLSQTYLQHNSTSEQQRIWHNALIGSYGHLASWGELPDNDGGYGWTWLAWHLAQAGRVAELRDVLLNATYLQHKIERCKTAAVLGDCAFLPDDPVITLLARALSWSISILDKTTAELPNQIFGRAGTQIPLHTLPPWTGPHLRLLSATLIQANGDLLRILSHDAEPTACAFSPDGRYVLAASSDNMLKLWEVNSGACIQSFQGHTSSVSACAFSPDGRYILSASGSILGEDIEDENTLKLWEISSGKCVQSFRGHKKKIQACAFSPDGRYILSGAASIRASDTSLMLAFLALSGNKRSATLDDTDNTLRLWKVSSGKCIHAFQDHTKEMYACTFSPDGRYVLGASSDRIHGSYSECTMQLWETNTGELIRTFKGHINFVNACAFSPDGSYALSASDDWTLRLWEVDSGKSVHTFYGHSGSVKACAFSSDGQFALSTSDDKTTRLWRVNTDRYIHTFQHHTSRVTTCGFSPDGRYALSASSDNTLRLWDVRSRQCLHTVQDHTREVSYIFAPDSRHILSASGTVLERENILRLWKVSSGKCVRTFRGHTEGVYSYAFSPDSRYALSASSDNTLRLWEIGSGECIRIFQGHNSSLKACAFSPDGRYALSASDDSTLRLWEVSSGECIRIFQVNGSPNSCKFSPDGRYILSSGYSDEALQPVLWDVSSDQCLHRFKSDKNINENTYAFSPDSCYILCTSDDKALQLWDITSEKTACSWRADADITSCAFSHDGIHIIAGDAGGAVHFLAIEGLSSHGKAPSQQRGVSPPDPLTNLRRLLQDTKEEGLRLLRLRFWREPNDQDERQPDLQQQQEVQDPDTIKQTLQTWLTIPNHRDGCRFLEAHPELLHPFSDWFLKDLIAYSASQPEVAQALRDQLDLLRDVRMRGTTGAAIREGYVNAYGGFSFDVPTWIEDIESLADNQGQLDQTVATRAALLSQAITRARHERGLAPEIQAELNILLWNALHDGVSGNLQQTQEEGIACLKAALQVYTHARYPRQYGKIQYILGASYAERIAGKRQANQERAIACCQEALRLYTLDAFPKQYAAVQYLLGATYTGRISGERRTNQERAITCFQEALRVFTLDAFPEQHAATQKQLGAAYVKRIEGERQANLKEAITCFQEAQRVYTPDAFPDQYAATQNHLESIQNRSGPASA